MGAAPAGLQLGATWPLVGRDGERRLLRGLLAAGARGLVVAGAPGVGKSRLATDFLQEADGQGVPTAQVCATRAAAQLPFGAVAPLLPAAGWPEATPAGIERAELLRRFAAALSERAGGRRLVLLVDDAHLLDDASATLIYQLATTGTALVVATVRTGERAPDPVLALWKDGVLDRLELEGLDGQSVDALLAEVLGGPVDPATVVRLAARCQGNVLFLRELVLGALHAGALAFDGALWRLPGRLAPSGRLVELVEARLAGLAPEERALLETVAVGEPLATAELAALGDLGAAESLERAGLLVSRVEGRRLEFGLAHPLHGEVLRQRMSALRHRTVAAALADVVERAGTRRAEDQLRVATWRLDAGGASADLLLAAAATAQRRYDYPLAERLARAAVQEGAGVPAAVEAARLASVSGRNEQAEAELSALAEAAGGDGERALVASARVDNLHLTGRFADALALAAQYEAAIADEGGRAEIASRRVGIVLDTRGPAAAAEAYAGVCRQAAGGALALGSLFGALALARTGDLQEAVRVARRGADAHRHPGGSHVPWLAAVLVLAEAEALAFAGRLVEAEALAMAEHDRAVAAGSVEAQACAAWQLAKVLLLQGRVESAARHGREAAALLRHLGRRVLLRDVLAPLATAEALRGAPGAASEVLREIDDLGLDTSAWTGADLLGARAWTSVAAGDVAAARAHLDDAVALAGRTGDRVGAATALHDLARLGFARHAADRLGTAAADVEGELGAARAGHAAALARNDAPALEAASSAFEAMGAWLLAAEAAADAGAAWRRAADARRATAAARRAATLGERCEGAATPALQAVEVRGMLTPAERQVAAMAAAGRSNRDIAAALYLSLRTVENRLHRIYEKLGISGRAELASALEG